MRNSRTRFVRIAVYFKFLIGNDFDLLGGSFLLLSAKTIQGQVVVSFALFLIQ